MARGDKRRQRAASEPIAETLQIETLAHGGDAVTRLDGRALFVSDAVPGDLIRAQEVRWQGKGSYGRVDRYELIEASPDRRLATCPHRPACGGCPWHEVAPALQAEAKLANTLEALRRVGRVNAGGLPPLLDGAIEQPGPALGYRLRARLTLARDRQGVRAGYLKRGSRHVVNVERCALLVPHLVEPVARALALARKRRWPSGELLVSAGLDPMRAAAAFLPRRPGRLARVLDDLIEAGFDGAEVVSGAPRVSAASGLTAGELLLSGVIAPGIEGGPYSHDALTFTQVSDAGGRALLRAVERALPATQPVLELHAGAGNLSLALVASGRPVTALEQHPRTLRYLQQNVARAGRGEQLRVVPMDAERVEQVAALAPSDLGALLLDPPRRGYPPLASLVERIRPPRVVYVSCDPATLARDCAELVGLGYRATALQVLDLMPGTWHVESVLVLER